VAEDVVELEYRDPPRVLHGRIERDAVLLARQHLAEPAEADERRIVLPHVRLERLAVSGDVVGHTGILGAPAAALEVIAADEIGMLVGDVAKSRDVRRNRSAVVERRLGPDASWDVPAAADSHDVLAQITAE